MGKKKFDPLVDKIEFPAKLTWKQRFEIVKLARKLITKKENWTQGSWRSKREVTKKNGNGYKVVKCYCAQGAINEAAARLGYVDINPNDLGNTFVGIGPNSTARQKLTNLVSFADHIKKKYKQGVTNWNDQYGSQSDVKHAEVLAEFDAYAKVLKRKAR